MSERRKVTVVGAGNVGATCAQELARRDYADVVLVDIKEGLAAGKALDINQAGAVLGYEPNEPERVGLRKIKVKVNRKNVAVRARASYTYAR